MIYWAGTAGTAWAEWDEARCVAEVAAARRHAASLPDGHLSRRFAEHDLAIAIQEMNAGEVDECEELVARATETIESRPYVLRDGETLNGYGPDRNR